MMKKIIAICLGLCLSMAMMADRWVRVKKAADLQEGDQVVLANIEHSHTANTTISSGTVKALGAVLSTGTSEEINAISETTAIFTLIKSDNAWKFAIEGVGGTFYLGATAVRSLSWTAATDTWYITSDTMGVITIESTKAEYGKLQYNYNAGNARFVNYTTNQTPIQLYKRKETPRRALVYQGYPYIKTACADPTYEAGDQVVLSSGKPSRVGAEFLGWEFKGQLFQPGETFVMPDEDVALVAKWNDGQAIDNTPVRVNAKKVLRDGQLRIIRDGIEYNAQGVRVK